MQFRFSVGELEKSVGDSIEAALAMSKECSYTELRSNKTKDVKELYAGYCSNDMCRLPLEALEVYV